MKTAKEFILFFIIRGDYDEARTRERSKPVNSAQHNCKNCTKAKGLSWLILLFLRDSAQRNFKKIVDFHEKLSIITSVK